PEDHDHDHRRGDQDEPDRHQEPQAPARGPSDHWLTLIVMSETVVMKFGGTSVADAERIKRAAARIVAKAEAGQRVVAVLSARGSTTAELMSMAGEVSPHPDPRELDMLLS